MKKSLYSRLLQPKVNDVREHSLISHLANGQVWYVVHCKPNCEQMALHNLMQQDFPVFLPLQKLTRSKGAVFETRTRPLFPGYMFVALDPSEGEWRKINNTRGVARLLHFAEVPTPVPSTIMEQLFARCDASGVFQQSANLGSGDSVEISQGPFSGAIGEIIEIEPNHRIHLLIDFMGQKSTITINSGGVT